MRDRSWGDASACGSPRACRRVLLQLLALAGLGFGGAGGRGLRAQESALRVVGSADPPYRVFGADGPSGLYFDLMREAARRLAWPVSFIEVPSARAFKMMENGEADLMLGPLLTPERQRFLSYTQVLLPAEDKVFYGRPDAPPLRRLADLEGRMIAVHRGKRYGAAFDTLPGLRLQEVNDYRVALDMVALGRVDLAVVPERQGDLLLRQRQLDLRKQALRLEGETAYLVLSRRSPWLARQAQLEHAFQAMRDDGSWQRLVAAYR